MSAPHVCILTSQYFAWGKWGGFASMSRQLAEGLVEHGFTVSVIVPRRQNQRAVEELRGVDIRSFPSLDVAAALRVIRQTKADLFHSQDPTLLTLLAERVHPENRHLVTCRDPRDAADWWTEFRYASAWRRVLTPFNYLTESSALVGHAVRRAHGVYCPAHFLKAKVTRVFRTKAEPQFLANLIDVPRTVPQKGPQPTLLFLARWDRRKRPERFLELAGRFPEYRFISIGEGEDRRFTTALRARFAHLPNLEMPGFIDRFHEHERLRRLLSDAWILVNTSAREGLPLAFLEAAGHGAAILSAVDPDGFASRFGAVVHDDDFEAGLRTLMADSPMEKGRRAYEYVRDTSSHGVALAAHMTEYHRHLGMASSG